MTGRTNEKIRRSLASRRGSGYVGTCVAVLAFLMLFSAVLTAFAAVSRVRVNRENVQRALDSFVTRTSTEIYGHIKRGNADMDDEAWNAAFFASLTAAEAGARKEGDKLVCRDPEDGTVLWTMDTPELSFTDGEVLRLRASYTLTMPVPFAGVTLGTVTLPLSVEAHFLPKGREREY